MFKRILIAAAAVTLLAACISKNEEFTVDYGNSSIYSQADMDSAIKEIKKTFQTFKGCELHSIRYAGDDCMNSENLNWMNSLGDHAPYAWCIEFLSDFHSPKEQTGAWNADFEYKDWQWWLARTEDGEWELLTYGY